MAAEFVNRLECIEIHRQSREAMQDALNQIGTVLQTGLGEIRDELRELNSRTRKAENAIAVLEDRSNRAETLVTQASHAARVGNARWGSIGALIGGALAAGLAYFTSGSSK